MVYHGGHTVRLPRASLTIYLLTLFTIIMYPGTFMEPLKLPIIDTQYMIKNGKKNMVHNL